MKAKRIDGPLMGFWSTVTFIFYCRHRYWFPTGYGPHCARCLTQLRPEDCEE